jgi:hypothetical protein
MEVGYSYRGVAKWLTRECIPAQRGGKWAAQSVKNLVVRYRRFTGKRLLIPAILTRCSCPLSALIRSWTASGLRPV